MISDNHYIELYVGGQLVELESQDSLNLRLQAVLFDPTKVATTQGEYSFSFSLPSTPQNDKIFEYANNLAKINKFRNRYDAEVYADGDLIFNGSLTLQKYNGREKQYECNLVSIKVNSIEDIFGEDVLTDMKWEVPFDGIDTINEVNQETYGYGGEQYKYIFPLICYGAFAKSPEYKDEFTEEYTSKYRIDSTNLFYIEDFYPSLNVVEEMKKCFESKGYTVQGNILSDTYLNEIYASTNLADDQNPQWNLGNPKFGKIKLDFEWDDPRYENLMSIQDLKVKYMPVGWEAVNNGTKQRWKAKAYNFDEITYHSMLDYLFYPTDSAQTYTNMLKRSYSNGRETRYIVIPKDGWYRIALSGDCKVYNSPMHINEPLRGVKQNVLNSFAGGYHYFNEVIEETIDIPMDVKATTPFEIQLVKNVDENIELIKGMNNLNMVSGKPDDRTITLVADWEGHESEYLTIDNFQSHKASYPHEQLGRKESCVANEVAWSSSGGNLFIISNYDKIEDTFSRLSEADYGYNPDPQTVMCYDAAVSPAFVCGWTSMGNKEFGGTVAFCKDGYSWSLLTNAERTEALYNQEGYRNGEYPNPRTNLNKNRLKDAPNGRVEYYSDADGYRHVVGQVYGMVKLNQGDILDLICVKRAYRNENGGIVDYLVDADSMHLEIEAVTDKPESVLRAIDYSYTAQTEYPSQLNLFNFTNKEVKVSEWLDGIAKAFNLTYEVDGNTVVVNTNKGLKKDVNYAISLDDRVDSELVESERIKYPKEMSVEYKINDDEHGFYESVPEDKLEEENWKDYAERGYSVIKLSDDAYETQSQKVQLQQSYTWYSTFTFEYYAKPSPYASSRKLSGEFNMPVIEEEEYMIDRVNDVEAMAHRGYKLPQRFWFKGTPINGEWSQFWCNTYFGMNVNKVYGYSVTNALYDGSSKLIELNYKDENHTLLTEYYNVYPELASNFINVDAFITPQEYIQLKNGAMVDIDSDLYYTSQISGFDPSGANLTNLKLVKKT